VFGQQPRGGRQLPVHGDGNGNSDGNGNGNGNGTGHGEPLDTRIYTLSKIIARQTRRRTSSSLFIILAVVAVAFGCWWCESGAIGLEG
jgi:hypothetical protein